MSKLRRPAALRTSCTWALVPALTFSEMSMATRMARGTISFRSASFFSPNVPSGAIIIPVILAPGRAKLAANPAATGSTLFRNTIGTVDVALLLA